MERIPHLMRATLSSRSHSAFDRKRVRPGASGALATSCAGLRHPFGAKRRLRAQVRTALRAFLYRLDGGAGTGPVCPIEAMTLGVPANVSPYGLRGQLIEVVRDQIRLHITQANFADRLDPELSSAAPSQYHDRYSWPCKHRPHPSWPRSPGFDTVCKARITVGVTALLVASFIARQLRS